MKKKTLTIAVLLCVACFAAGAAATGIVRNIQAELRPDFTIIIDGEEKIFKNVNGEVVEPILYDGTTYLPVRAIGEMMGKTVFWYEKKKTIELKEVSSTVTDTDVVLPSSKDNSISTVKEKPKSEPEPEPKPEPKPEPVKEQKTDTSEFIGEAKAKEIALKKAGLKASEVVFERTELDKDNGVWHYEIEFRKGIVEYSADVNAITGAVSDFEKDIDD